MYRVIKGSMVALASVGMLGVTTLAADAALFPFDSTELSCRKALAKNLGKAIKSGHKTIEKCHKGRNAEKVAETVDCNLLDMANADSKGKFQKAQDKLTAAVQKSCIDSGASNDVLNEYVSCPEPCTTNLVLSNPLNSYSELSQCLNCVASEISQDWGTLALGSPTIPIPKKPEALCHATIGKAYGKYLDTIIKDRQKCQDAADKAGATEYDQTGCSTNDEKGKIAKALTKAGELMDKKCVGADVSLLDTCSAVDLNDVKTCNEPLAATAGDDGLAAGYELEATICPTGLDSLVRGTTTFEGDPTDTLLEVGWTGLAHYSSLQDNYYISIDATCPGPGPGSCGDCVIDGISSTGPQYAQFTRCANDFSQPCTMPFLADPACGGGTCNYVLGPPLPISAGNTPTCSINTMAADISGTADPDAGSAEIDITLATIVHLGSSLTKPCPVCAGDTDQFDNVASGTCVGGQNDGGPCDAQGFDATFAPSAEGFSLSLDCPPDQLANISGSGLAIGLELTTSASSLSFDNACDPPLGAFACACGVCTHDGGVACRNDAECDALSGGSTCTSIGGGVPRQPNGCADGVCSVDSGEVGICNAGPTDKFCDGQLTAQGEGFLGCTTNGDCSAIDDVCGDGSPGSCGSCTVSRTRSCFLDPINATGVADPDTPLLVSTFCLPPTNATAINVAAGSPGPARTHVQQDATFRYD